MEDLEFDRSFEDKMRRASAPDFIGEDWQKLSAKLRSEQGNSRNALVATAPAFLLLLLLGSHYFWWSRFSQTSQQLAEMKARISTLQSISNPTARDTVWMTRIVHHYDTVFQTRILQSYGPGSSTTSASIGRQPSEALPASEQYHELTPTPTISTNSESLTDTDLKDLGKIPVRNLPPYRIRNKQAQEPGACFQEIIPARKAPNQASILQLRPRSFWLGAGAGFLIPGGPNLMGKSGYSTTFNAEIGFSDQLSLVVDAHYMGAVFHGTAPSEALGLPAIPAPPGNFSLKYFTMEDGAMPLLQIATGMQYMMWPSRRLRPYASLSYAALWRLPYEIQYEFEDTQTGLEKEVSREVTSTSAATSMIGLGSGIRYRLTKQFYLKTGINYQFKPDPDQPGFPNIWGINALLQYRF